MVVWNCTLPSNTVLAKIKFKQKTQPKLRFFCSIGQVELVFFCTQLVRLQKVFKNESKRCIIRLHILLIRYCYTFSFKEFINIIFLYRRVAER